MAVFDQMCVCMALEMPVNRVGGLSCTLIPISKWVRKRSIWPMSKEAEGMINSGEHLARGDLVWRQKKQ